jgi:hypothetical protein
MWYVIALAWIAVTVGVIMAYTRKQRRRSAERSRQMDSLLADLKANPRAALEAIKSAAAPAAAAATPQFSLKPRLLPQATAMLYYVFRTGLRDHEVFAGMALGDVLDLAPGTGGAQRDQLRQKLDRQRLDLVICTKQFEVVAVVVVQNAARGAQDEGVQVAARCLEAAGVRVVKVDPAAPPRHHQVNALVYG